MSNVLKQWFRLLRKQRFHYTPLVIVEISKTALLGNLEAFKKQFPGHGIAPVLKSNAYGHGLVQVARILDGSGAPFFVVDSYVEALMLRNEGIRTPLLIIGYTLPDNIVACTLPDVAFTIGNCSDLETLARCAKRAITIHLKIDTGMHRQGIACDDFEHAIQSIQASPHLVLEGIATHLADADGNDKHKTQKQIALWNSCVHTVRAALPTIPFVHCAATHGARFSNQIDANCIRLGVGLYGCIRDYGDDVRPALEMKTIVTSVRTIKTGESLGYNFTYTAPHDMRIATVPVGYSEGVDRRLSNVGEMSIRNISCPIVGRVSMNMTMIDVTHVDPPATVGDEVVVIGRDPATRHSCESIARLCGTIPHEILVHVSPSLRRTIA